MKIFTGVLVIFIFVLDQISKFFISRNIDINESVPVIRNIFHITLVQNTGAAFGIFKSGTLFFITISILAVGAITMHLIRKPSASFLFNAALSLILGGVLGNLVDRVRLGYVIDFLDFRVWPVFNVADSAITIGVILLILSLLRKKRYAPDTF